MKGRLENEIKREQYISAMLNDLPDYVNDWHLNLKASNKTAATRCDFLTKIRRFLYSINDIPKFVTTRQITEDVVISYFISCQRKETKDGIETTSSSYQRGVYNCLNNFLGFLSRRGEIPTNYMQDITKPKDIDKERVNRNRILLTEKDFQNILDAVEDNTRTRLICSRDRAILLTLMTTGMRETALTEINNEDIDFENHTLTVVDKGNKTQVYKLSPILEAELKQYIWFKEQKSWGRRADALFLSQAGKERLHRNSISQIVKKYSELGIGYAVSPHKLRAGFCSIMYSKTNNIEFVRRAVGHSDISTTQRYIVTDQNEREEAANIMEQLLK